MKKISAAVLFAVFFLLGTVMFSTVSSAYIDPSAASFIWQAVAGIVVVCAGGFAFFFRKMKRKLKKETADKPKDVNMHDGKDGFDDSEFDA